MKIAVRTIPAQGLEFKETIEPVTIGLSEAEIHAIQPLEVEACIQRVGQTVLAHTQVGSRYGLNCARCLKEVEINCRETYDFDYHIVTGQETIDLDEDIRQEVILHIPNRVLCKPDCKGLCPGCGGDLNVEACRCKK